MPRMTLLALAVLAVSIAACMAHEHPTTPPTPAPAPDPDPFQDGGFVKVASPATTPEPLLPTEALHEPLNDDWSLLDESAPEHTSAGIEPLGG